MNEGYLSVRVVADDISQPIKGAKVEIVGIDEEYITDENGTTGKILLETTNISNSLEPNKENPYKLYDIIVSMIGMTTTRVNDIEIFPTITSSIEVILKATDELSEINEEYKIPPITLDGDYSPKYDEDENLVSSIVLDNVIIPEYIIVHDGIPSNTTSPNYKVSFVDYIKNVASSEIYPTWNKEALRANVLAIMSFTLNRIYTEWYISKGYDFTITSTTSYDQKYTFNRPIFDSISLTVDELIGRYIKRPNKDEPLFSQYCDGYKLKNKGWLWQWGSNDLAIQGKNSEEILKFYYGDNLVITTAKYATGLPSSYPGYELKLGSCGEEVKKFQNEINIIKGNYSGLIGIVNPNGFFDEQTTEAVEFFQGVFGLTVTGIVDYSTWYKISYLYIAVSKMLLGVYDR